MLAVARVVGHDELLRVAAHEPTVVTDVQVLVLLKTSVRVCLTKPTFCNCFLIWAFEGP